MKRIITAWYGMWDAIAAAGLITPTLGVLALLGVIVLGIAFLA